MLLNIKPNIPMMMVVIPIIMPAIIVAIPMKRSVICDPHITSFTLYFALEALSQAERNIVAHKRTKTLW